MTTFTCTEPKIGGGVELSKLYKLGCLFNVRRKNSVAAPTPNSLGSIAGAIVVAETTVLAAATLSRVPSPQEGQQRERHGDGEATPVAASPSLDIQGVC